MSNEVGPVLTLGPGAIYLRPELRDLKIIGVEEHVIFPHITKDISPSPAVAHAGKILSQIVKHPALQYSRGRVTDIGSQRLKDMNEGGVHMQVLSYGGAVNTTHTTAEEGLRIAQRINDALKSGVDANPDRFKAFAELPCQDPELAIHELRRCVSELGFVGAMVAGSVGGKFFDAPEFDSLLSEFEALDVPLYLHPGIAPEPVMEAYYNFPDNPFASACLGTMGWGWHNEVAIHVLRLAISGTLDRHPKLKIIVGHQGEMMPMMMQRWDGAFEEKTFGLKRSVGETLRAQVWIAISGLFTIPATLVALQTWGVDRVLFANDYPYVDAHRVPEYVRALGDVVGPSDMKKIFQTNTEELLKIKM